jgi:hypothetical protein
MKKWRPSHKALYVIPEIHGNAETLEVILNKILPLRFFKNQEDMLVCLGDYIDKEENGHLVLDILINIKNEYKDRVILLKGNHEEMMLRALYGSDNDFNYWIDNNGLSTVSGYLKRNGMNTNAYSITKGRFQDLVPKTHIELLKSLSAYAIIDDYCFFHGGFNIEKSIVENNISNFMFDNTSNKYVKDCIRNKIEPLFKDDYIFVGAHNYMGKEPFIHRRYFALGGNASPRKLYVFDLNSMAAGYVNRGKGSIINYRFKTYE